MIFDTGIKLTPAQTNAVCEMILRKSFERSSQNVTAVVMLSYLALKTRQLTDTVFANDTTLMYTASVTEFFQLLTDEKWFKISPPLPARVYSFVLCTVCYDDRDKTVLYDLLCERFESLAVETDMFRQEFSCSWTPAELLVFVSDFIEKVLRESPSTEPTQEPVTVPAGVTIVEPVESTDSYRVLVTDVSDGSRKVNLVHLVKLVRVYAGLGLREGRDFIDSIGVTHGVICEDVTKEKAMVMKNEFEKYGCSVRVISNND